MRTILDFFKAIILALRVLLLNIYKVLAAILLFGLVSFLVGIFISPQLMILVWTLGVLGMSLFLFIPRFRQMLADIYIIRKGYRYNGICLGMTKPIKAASFLIVKWNDNNGKAHMRSFNATDRKSKYPHGVNVYSYDNNTEHTNLGWRTLIRDIGYVLTFLPFVAFTAYMNYVLIHEIIQKGINSIT